MTEHIFCQNTEQEHGAYDMILPCGNQFDLCVMMVAQFGHDLSMVETAICNGAGQCIVGHRHNVDTALVIVRGMN